VFAGVFRGVFDAVEPPDDVHATAMDSSRAIAGQRRTCPVREARLGRRGMVRLLLLSCSGGLQRAFPLLPENSLKAREGSSPAAAQGPDVVAPGEGPVSDDDGLGLASAAGELESVVKGVGVASPASETLGVADASVEGVVDVSEGLALESELELGLGVGSSEDGVTSGAGDGTAPALDVSISTSRWGTAVNGTPAWTSSVFTTLQSCWISSSTWAFMSNRDSGESIRSSILLLMAMIAVWPCGVKCTIPSVEITYW
jgi:hypothetical protein